MAKKERVPLIFKMRTLMSEQSIIFVNSRMCSCVQLHQPTAVRSSTSVAGSWTAPEGLAGCARRQTAPDRPERRRKKEEMREAYFELTSSKNHDKQHPKMARLVYCMRLLMSCKLFWRLGGELLHLDAME